MKTNHPTKKLGEVLTFNYGKGLPKKERSENGEFSVYGANGELGRSNKFLIEGEGIIVGRKGSAGELMRVSGKYWPTDVTYYITESDQYDIDYIYQLLRSLNLPQYAKGVKPGINRNDIYEIEIPLPPLKEQKRIVKILDQKLGAVREAIALRESALADTEKILSARLREIFEQGKKDGWNEKELGELFNITSSKRVFKSEWQEDGIPFYRAREIVSLALGRSFRTPIFISEKMYKEYGEKYGLPQENDLLVTGVGTLGISYIVKKEDKFYFKDGNIIWLQNESETKPQFVQYFFKSDLFKKYIDETSAGATVRTYTITNAKKTKIPLPNLKTQEKIVAELDALSARVAELRVLETDQLADLKRLERAYLREAFNGEL